MRWIADLGDPDGSLAVIPGGQAGHPFDPHFDDQLKLYLAGRLHEVRWTEEAIRAATVSTLWLER
jgi:penicillin amidase